MKIDMIACELIDCSKSHRKDMGNIDKLQASIETLGLLQPIGITASHRLIWGSRRLQVFKNLGRSEIPVYIFDLDEMLRAEYDENTCRKDMTVSEKTALAKALEEEAKKTDRRGRPKNKNEEEIKEKGAPRRTFLESTGKTRDSVAKDAGFESSRQLDRAKAVAEKASADIKSAIDDEIITLTDAESILDLDHEAQDACLHKVVYGLAKTLKAAAKILQREREADAGQAEVTRDTNGVIIPDHLLPIVEDTVLMDEILELARQMKRKLNELDKRPVSEDRNRGQLQHFLKNIEVEMEQDRFAFVCPACQGALRDHCSVCMDRRWWPVHSKDKINVKKYLRAS